MDIYRTYDIHGKIDEEITSEHYRAWGMVLASMSSVGAKFLVAQDSRTSSSAYLSALVEGLSLGGVAPVLLGELPAAVVYYGLQRTKASGCAIVTGGSHPDFINGLKWQIGLSAPSATQLSILANETAAILGETRPQTNSDTTFFAVPLDPSARLPDGIRRCPPNQMIHPRTLDITFDYVARLQEIWFDTPKYPLSIVLDPIHGAWSTLARRYLQAIFPHVIFTCIRDQKQNDSETPSPHVAFHDQLPLLGEQVDKTRADFGIAFDADGHAIALVDELGVPLQTYELSWLIIKNFEGILAENDTIPIDTMASVGILQTLENLNVTPQIVGDCYVEFLRVMLEHQSPFGIHSGGLYFNRSRGGHADPLYIACHVINALSTTQRPLSVVRKSVPKYCVTPLLWLPVTQFRVSKILQQFLKYFGDQVKQTPDGIHICLAEGTMMIREAVDESKVIFRFEAADRDHQEWLVRKAAAILGIHGEALMDLYMRSL